MIDDDPLLNVEVGGESTRSEIGRDAAAEVLVVLVEHVDEVVFAEELLAEGVADEVEGIRTDIGEDFVREVGGADEEDEFADEEVGGEAGGFGGPGLVEPELCGVEDHGDGGAEEGDDEGGTREGTAFTEVGELGAEEEEEEGGGDESEEEHCELHLGREREREREGDGNGGDKQAREMGMVGVGFIRVVFFFPFSLTTI